MKRKLFVAFKSIDEKERLVVGVLAEQALDKDGEVFDYATSKKYFEKWNKFFSEKTQQLGVEESLGNMRVMHTKTLGGKFVEMTYNDDAQNIEVVAKVTDDKTWNEVLEGLYTGFSIGARVVKKWKDKDGVIHWTADPFEGSIVDNPAMYGAQITAVKADGTSAEIKFAGKNSHAEKSMWTAQNFISIVSALCDMCCSMDYEEEYEQDEDGAALATKIRDTAKQLGEMCKQYVSHEIDELNPSDEVTEMADGTKKTVEAGERPAARNAADEPGIRPVANKSEGAAAAAAAPQTTTEKTVAQKATKSQLEAIVTAFVTSIQAIVNGGDGEEAAVETAKAAGAAAVETTEKTVSIKESELQSLRTTVAEQGDALKKTNELLEKFSNMALPSAVRTKTVSKETDGVETTEKAETKVTDPLVAIKSIHASGPKFASVK